jgi:para-nitrobenzyl esterase
MNRLLRSITCAISIALFFVAIGLVCPLMPAQDSALVVKSTLGDLQGRPRTGGGAEFLGIPYAQPPVGDLRWREPVPMNPWSGLRQATTFGAPCSQPDLGEWNRHDAETGKEDCLFLNVIVPEWPVAKPLPVMFWIHGGANEGGTASSALYKDGTLVNRGVILVTVNYRLGIFGFLANPELTAESAHHASGNYGLMDQVLALHWVHENIARFGGDVNNITVFGQSAGSMDTSMLMTSPLAKEMFQKAIGESGAAFTAPMLALPAAEHQGVSLAQQLGAPAGSGQIKFLRTLSAADLLATLGKVPNRHVGADIDGWVLPEQPAVVFASGREAHIPLLYGTTTREFENNQSAAQLRATIAFTAGNLSSRTQAAYGLDNDGQGTADPKYGTAADQWAADMMFRCPGTVQGLWHAAAHNPTYEYEFNHAIPGQENAVHSADLPYVFGYFPKWGNISGKFTDLDTKLSDLMDSYWTNFARTGNPNGPGLPNWPQQGDSGAYIQFQQDGAVQTAAGMRTAQCNLYREWLTAHTGAQTTAH